MAQSINNLKRNIVTPLYDKLWRIPQNVFALDGGLGYNVGGSMATAESESTKSQKKRQRRKH